MSHPSTASSRALALIVAPLALLATFVSIAVAVGQETGDEPVSSPLVAGQVVSVIGDSLLSGTNAPPLRDGSCSRSGGAPVEAAVALLDRRAGIIVENHSCAGADLTDVVIDQVPDIDRDSALVVIGGASLEFDWPSLSEACLSTLTRSVEGCDRRATAARAAAANSFFAWRSLLQQIDRHAPDARILLVGSPVPVSTEPNRIGSACCGENTDANERVRAVFDTARSSRLAVTETLDSLDIGYIAGDELFAGHGVDSPEPWLANEKQPQFVFGDPTTDGNATLADAIADHLPEPMISVAADSGDGTVHIDLIIATDPGMADELDSLASYTPEWFADLSIGGRQVTVSLVPISATAGPVENVNSPEDFARQLGELDLDGEPPSMLAIVDTLSARDRLEIGDRDSKSVAVVWVDTLSDPSPPLISLTEASGAGLTFLATELELFRELVDLTTDSAATVAAVPDPDSLADALPVPDPLPPVQLPELDVPLAFHAVEGRTAELSLAAQFETALDGTIEWRLGDTLLGTGQSIVAETTGLEPGEYEIEIEIRFDDAAALTEVTLQSLLVVTPDGDTIGDGDVCPSEFDPPQHDTDGDGSGDACDDDDDDDGIDDGSDPCPSTANRWLFDIDGDRLPDVCDADPLDGPAADWDGDGSPDSVDVCPTVADPSQADADGDGSGDACDETTRPICTIFGTDGDDRLVGTSRDDIICGFGGDDMLVGGAGHDILLGGDGNDVIRGHDGDDLIVGGSGDDALHGGAGFDTVIGADGDDLVKGGAHGDALSGGSGRDRLLGGGGHDVLVGGGQDDRLVGDEGDDVLLAGSGSDSLFGREGDDLLDSGNGSDTVRGGVGDDLIVDARTRDEVIGGGGADVIGGRTPLVD